MFTVIYKSDNSLSGTMTYVVLGRAKTLEAAAKMRQCNGDLVYEGDTICTDPSWLFERKDIEGYAMRMMKGEAPPLSKMYALQSL